MEVKLLWAQTLGHLLKQTQGQRLGVWAMNEHHAPSETDQGVTSFKLSGAMALEICLPCFEAL